MAYGIGSRIKLAYTRAIIDAILDGRIEDSGFDVFPIFNFQIPKKVPHVDSNILNPKQTWSDAAAYDAMAKKLASQFNENFKRFSSTLLGKKLSESGPTI